MNVHASELFSGDPSTYRDEIASHPFRAYDQLEEHQREATPEFERRVHSALRNGWDRDGVTVDLRSTLPWNEHSRTHQFHLHAWEPLGLLLPACDFFEGPEPLSVSLEIATDWIERFQRQHLSQDLRDGLEAALRDETTMAWYDMAVGQRAPRLAYLIDVVARGHHDDELFGSLFRSLVFQMEMLSVESFWKKHNNHGLYQALGQLAAARRFQFLPGFGAYYELARQRTETMLRGQFFQSGIHTEHSPAYHRMIMRSVSGALRCGLIQDPGLVDLLDRSEEALRWMMCPDRSLVTFGDTDYHRDLRDDNAPPYGINVFKDAGYVFARKAGADGPESDSYFAQMAAFHSRTHKHADHLTFAWHDQGKRILIDPGRYGYGPKTTLGDDLSMAGFYYSDPRRIYVERTRAHNCVEIDGQDYRRKGAKPFQSALLAAEEQDGVWLTLCEVRHRHVRHFRTIIVGPGSFLLVLDWLHDGTGQDHTYRQWFQLAPEWIASAGPDDLHASSGDVRLSVRSLIQETEMSSIFLGSEDPMQGWSSPSAGKLVPSPSFNFSLTGQTARFATLFSLSADIIVEKVSLNGTLSKGKVCWTADGQYKALSFEREGSKVSVALAAKELTAKELTADDLAAKDSSAPLWRRLLKYRI